MPQNAKTMWSKPSVTSYGSVEDITAGDKKFGFQDLFLISIGPITIPAPGKPKPGGGTGS